MLDDMARSHDKWNNHQHDRAWGPFLESPGNFSGPKSKIKMEI